MTDDLKQKTAARLTHRHLLGIEGLSVLEMRSLLTVLSILLMSSLASATIRA